jgi:hypothetical protein
VEAGGGADQLGVTLQLSAASELDVFELLDRREMAVDQTAVGQRPQVLSRLQFGRVGGQEEQVHVVGDAQLDAGVPAGTVEHEHNLLGGAGADGTGEGREFDREQCNGDRGRQVEDSAARGGMDEADEVAPGEAVADQRERALANGRPDAPQQRFEADPVLIDGPQLDPRVRKGGRDRP